MGTKLRFRDRLGYGLGDFGSQFAFFIVNTYFMIFMTDVMGIANTTAGAVYAIVMIFDAINDPIIGNMADRSKTTKMGKYRRWVTIGAPFYAVCMWLSFLNPDWGMGGKVAWAIIIHMLYSVAATAWQVPYGSLPNRMTANANERVVLGTFRDWFANLAKFAIGYVGVLLITVFAGKDGGNAGYFGMAGVCALICVIFTLVAGFSSKEEVDMGVATEGEKVSLMLGLKTVFRNKPALLIMFVAFLATVALNFKSAVTPYYAAYVLGNPALAGTILPLIFTLPLLFGLLVPTLVKKMGEKNVFILSMVAAGLSGVISLLGSSMPMIIIASLLMSIMAAFLPPTLWGVLPGLTDYGEWKYGVSCPGSYYAVNAFFIKCSTGLSGLMIGWALAMGGYDAALPVQPESALTSISLWHGLVPIICCVISVVCMLFYKLKKEDLEIVQKELAERRTQVK